MTEELANKYVPRSITQVRGQPDIVRALRIFLKAPTSKAFLFYGEPGTGKTATGYALAGDLGVDPRWPGLGGFYLIPSGEQKAGSVREIMSSCRYTPMYGSGWRLVLVNEADATSPEAAMVWLDCLENLPKRTVVVFTTNEVKSLTQRFRDRCECYEFESDVAKLRGAAQELIDDVWRKELGRNHSPRLKDLGMGFEYGTLSFRQVLKRLEPVIRAEQAGEKVRFKTADDDAEKQPDGEAAARSAAPKRRKILVGDTVTLPDGSSDRVKEASATAYRVGLRWYTADKLQLAA